MDKQAGALPSFGANTQRRLNEHAQIAPAKLSLNLKGPGHDGLKPKKKLKIKIKTMSRVKLGAKNNGGRSSLISPSTPTQLGEDNPKFHLETTNEEEAAVVAEELARLKKEKEEKEAKKVKRAAKEAAKLEQREEARLQAEQDKAAALSEEDARLNAEAEAAAEEERKAEEAAREAEEAKARVEALRGDVDANTKALAKLWKKVAEPEEAQAAFFASIPEDDSKYTDAVLAKLTAHTSVLQAQLDNEFGASCVKLIKKRLIFIETWNAFEDNATNPDRFKGSSVKLLKEEKFRKNAWPKLQKKEKELLAALTSFIESTGKFYYYGGHKDYQGFLEHEIDVRPPPTSSGLHRQGVGEDAEQQL